VNKSDIIIIAYVIGIIFGALILGLWNAETSEKPLIGITWMAIFLIGLFYANKKDLR